MITDARHDSTSNAFHTTVPCLSDRLKFSLFFCTWCCELSLSLFCSTKRILGYSTKSRVDHLTAQTRELECTKEVLPSVINYLGMITTNYNLAMHNV